LTKLKIRVDCYSRPDDDSDEAVVREIKPAGAVMDFSGATVPRSASRKRLGLVPKMRLMFERARSLEPESRLNGRRKAAARFADGTESVTSFVLEDPVPTRCGLFLKSTTFKKNYHRGKKNYSSPF
jgi:hypothetical protein